jgi:hypothetical protein
LLFHKRLAAKRLLHYHPEVMSGLLHTGSGHWGLAFYNIEVNGGKTGEGPIEYYLPIRFHTIDSTKQFLDANPTAKIVKGKDLV